MSEYARISRHSRFHPMMSSPVPRWVTFSICTKRKIIIYYFGRLVPWRSHYKMLSCSLTIGSMFTLCVLLFHFTSTAVAVDSSHMTASSSASWSRFSPLLNFVRWASITNFAPGFYSESCSQLNNAATLVIPTKQRTITGPATDGGFAAAEVHWVLKGICSNW